MAVIVKKVDRYLINYVGGRTLQDGGPAATIDCSTLVVRAGIPQLIRSGSISFFADSRVTPANQYMAAEDTIQLYYEMSRFGDVVDILRYNKPLQIVVNTDTGYGYIGNAQAEATGQQEGV